MIDADPIGRAVFEEITSQAVANAVRHRGATQITLRWAVQSREGGSLCFRCPGDGLDEEAVAREDFADRRRSQTVVLDQQEAPR